MRLPVLNRIIFLQLFVIISLLMMIPSIVAFVEKDYFVGRTFCTVAWLAYSFSVNLYCFE